MAVRDARTFEQLRQEVALMGPQGRADGWLPLDDLYETGWETHGGTSLSTLGYRRVGDLVYVSIMCKRTSGTSLTIATLPEGYRPAVRTVCTGIQASDTPCRIDVLVDGSISMRDATGTFSYLSIELSFYSPITRR